MGVFSDNKTGFVRPGHIYQHFEGQEFCVYDIQSSTVAILHSLVTTLFPLSFITPTTLTMFVIAMTDVKSISDKYIFIINN